MEVETAPKWVNVPITSFKIIEGFLNHKKLEHGGFNVDHYVIIIIICYIL